MRSRCAEFSRRAVRGLLPAALLVLAPKCVLCALAYAGLGAALGLGGPELCGTTAVPPGSWASPPVWLGVAGGCGAFAWRAIRRRRRSVPAVSSLPPPTGSGWRRRDGL